MTYQGERARPLSTEDGRYFVVSKVRLDADGQVSAVLWGEVDAASGHDVGARVQASAAEVVDAIHDGATVAAAFVSGDAHARHPPERTFVVIQHPDGMEGLRLADAEVPGRCLTDIPRLRPPHPPRD
ncbi:hypothetical protein [Roseateles amylovorans]|uniref:Uncharacterized protein n=1 Tax=Roseateles amylovorans TaxID=2978473 RepID=A0ABY6AYB6_9BURK|nr:hypothetical protein [Roseateles amylovorans]UXH76085.1 hypothetical protein N4261_13475 [Roseateles amylovorans]